jgi:hypothetical protein
MAFTSDDYTMLPSDHVLNVDPGQAYVEVMLPYIGECTGMFYAITNIGAAGNQVHIVDKGDSAGFISPTDLVDGGAVIYFSNGVNWHLVYSNV